VSVTRGEHARVANDDPSRRHYFYLLFKHGEGAVLAERSLELHGASNFRDLGGYASGGGRRLKWGKLYRSGKLSTLTEEDRDKVRRLGLTLVCDFRQLIEQELEPTFIGHRADHQVASLPISPGSQASFLENLHRGGDRRG
jgi:protein-tyrosine phosphatase